MKTTIAILILSVAAALAGTIGTYTDPATANENWAEATLWDELTLVAAEIATAADYANARSSTNQVGDNAAPAAAGTTRWTLRAMQDMVETVYTNFCPTNFVLEGLTNSAVEGTAYSNLTHLFNVAGIHSNGWRRAPTNWPSDWTDLNDSAYQYGKCQTNDVVGPWENDDIQKTFDALSVQCFETEWANSGQIRRRTYGTNTTYASARTDAENAWPGSDSWTNGNDITSLPSSFYSVTVNGDASEYSVIIESSKARGLIRGGDLGIDGLTWLADFYLRANTSNEHITTYWTWNDAGDDVVEGEWHAFGNTTTNDGFTIQYSDFLGDAAIPSYPSDPGAGNSRGKGWDWWEAGPLETGPYTVIRYDWKYTRN